MLDRVVPADQRRLAQLADVAGEVVDEGVVVVDEENHEAVESGSGRLATGTAARLRLYQRLNQPRALSSVSRYSSSGSESATMPPPAWKYTCPPRARYGPDDDAGVHGAGGAD